VGRIALRRRQTTTGMAAWRGATVTPRCASISPGGKKTALSLWAGVTVAPPPAGGDSHCFAARMRHSVLPLCFHTYLCSSWAVWRCQRPSSPDAFTGRRFPAAPDAGVSVADVTRIWFIRCWTFPAALRFASVLVNIYRHFWLSTTWLVATMDRHLPCGFRGSCVSGLCSDGTVRTILSRHIAPATASHHALSPASPPLAAFHPAPLPHSDICGRVGPDAPAFYTGRRCGVVRFVYGRGTCLATTVVYACITRARRGRTCAQPPWRFAFWRLSGVDDI
jgi:hypothetical protein